MVAKTWSHAKMLLAAQTLLYRKPRFAIPGSMYHLVLGIVPGRFSNRIRNMFGNSKYLAVQWSMNSGGVGVAWLLELMIWTSEPQTLWQRVARYPWRSQMVMNFWLPETLVSTLETRELTAAQSIVFGRTPSLPSARVSSPEAGRQVWDFGHFAR